MRVVLAFLALATASNAWDSRFACCGGCSSSVRSAGEQLQGNAVIFPWQPQLPANASTAATTCAIGFPADASLGEAIGQYRVRSGGAQGELVHDQDALCCANGGLCANNKSDASGVCSCVQQWQFSGDHCELTVYDRARSINSELFPNITAIPNSTWTLPLLPAPEAFDLQRAIANVAVAVIVNASADANKTAEASIAAYQSHLWSVHEGAKALAGGIGACLIAFLLASWFLVRRAAAISVNAAKTYTMVEQVVWGILTLAAVAGASYSSYKAMGTWDDEVIQHVKAMSSLLDALPGHVMDFATASALQRIDEDYNPQLFAAVQNLITSAATIMTSHTFLDDPLDNVSRPVFQLLDRLAAHALEYPIAINASVDCSSVNNTGDTSAILGSGCIRCPTCTSLKTQAISVTTSWNQHIRQVQGELQLAKQQLIALGEQPQLLSALRSFQAKITSLVSNLTHACAFYVDGFKAVTDQLSQLDMAFDSAFPISIVSVSLATLGIGMMFPPTMVLIVCVLLVAGGGSYRPFPEFFLILAVLPLAVAFAMSPLAFGAAHTASALASDVLTVIQLFNTNTTHLIADPAVAAFADHILYDRSVVEEYSMGDVLAFADTLRVPPHATPDNNFPPPIDVTAMYDFPDLFAIENLCRTPDVALAQWFAWDDAAVQQQWTELRTQVFGNDTMPSPYNNTLLRTLLLHSSEIQLADVDGDGISTSASDLTYAQHLFNATWTSLPNGGAQQNARMVQQWYALAKILSVKQRLVNYAITVGSIITETRLLLDSMRQKTAMLASDEYSLKAASEVLVMAVRSAKLGDCGYNGNCAWLRMALNDLIFHCQQIIDGAQHAVAFVVAYSVCQLLFLLLMPRLAFYMTVDLQREAKERSGSNQKRSAAVVPTNAKGSSSVAQQYATKPAAQSTNSMT